MIAFGLTKLYHRHSRAVASRSSPRNGFAVVAGGASAASLDEWHGRWRFILRDARSALLKMTDWQGTPVNWNEMARSVRPSSIIVIPVQQLHRHPSDNGFAVVAGGASAASLEG
jgi:hypothetical protein